MKTSNTYVQVDYTETQGDGRNCRKTKWNKISTETNTITTIATTIKNNNNNSKRRTRNSIWPYKSHVLNTL